MSYENIKLNLNGNLYPLSQQNEVKEVEDFENVFFSEDGEYDESWTSFSDKQVNNNASSNVKNEKEELTEEEILIQQLEAEIAQLESEYSANQEGKGIAGAVGGFFSSCWNGITGKGFKNNDRAELDAKIAMLEAVKSDPAKLSEAYKTIMGTELTEEAKQSAVEAQKLADSMSEEEKQQVVEMLQEQAASLSTLMEQTQNDQGWFSKAMGGLNNVLGFGTNSNKANAKVEEYIKQVNSLDPNDPDFAAKYQALTGEALSVDGLDELSQGVSKVGNSPAAEAIMDYEETQAAAKEIGSGIVTGVVVAACVIAAPFTGGASIALGAAVGGATTVLINGTDTIGTSKKYSLEQGILDFGGGAINGAITAMTLGSAGIAGKGFSALKGAGSAAAKQGAKQMVSGGFKNTVKTAFNGFGKSALNGAKIAAFAASSNYLLDTVGTNALYDLTGNLAKSETPANIVQNEDGTYSVYYELKDANTGEVISYEIETVETLSQDEDGGLIKGNVVDVSRSNDFSFTEMAKQTAISAGTAALGAGIGKITGNIINPYATSMTNSVILGNTAEIASDMTLSLSADYLIASAQAGQFVDADEFFSWDRILGEGQNQIRGLLIGIASSKMNSLDAASVDAVRAGVDGKTGADGAEIPVVKPDDVPETEPLTSSTTKSVETPDNDAVPPATIKPEPDDNDAVLPATIKPEPADNAATEPIKIDGVELPKTQQEALTIAGKLIIEENNPAKARELLSSFGMSDAAIETFVAEAVKVQTEKAISEIRTPNKPAGRTPTQTDFSDPKYSDVVRMSSEIRAKFQQQMGVITEPEIDTMVKNIRQQFPDVSEAEVLDIMTRLTQFSSFTSLDALGKKLSGLDIGRFYAQGVNTGTALNYVQRSKKQFSLTGSKQGFVVDDVGLKYLEGLRTTDPAKFQKFAEQVQKGEIVLVQLDGMNIKLGDQYLSYGFFDGGQSLEAMTRAAVEMRQRTGASIDEILNSDITARTQTLLGSGVKIEPVKIETGESSTATVARQVEPKMPTEAEIRATIEQIAEERFSGDVDTAKTVLTKYYDSMLAVYSADAMVIELKNKYSAIEAEVQKQGKTMDDVVYVYPTQGKSFELVCLQFAKANGIDPSKMYHWDGSSTPSFDLNGKTVVLLDDVVGSGGSMLSEQFSYNGFLSHAKSANSNLIFSPIICAKRGDVKINDYIRDNHRVGIDSLIYGSDQNVNFETDFYNKLTDQEKQVFDVIRQTLGYGEAGMCTSFSYMIPDNCSGVSAYILRKMLLVDNHYANKTFCYDPELSKRIDQRAKMY